MPQASSPRLADPRQTGLLLTRLSLALDRRWRLRAGWGAWRAEGVACARVRALTASGAAAARTRAHALAARGDNAVAFPRTLTFTSGASCVELAPGLARSSAARTFAAEVAARTLALERWAYARTLHTHCAHALHTHCTYTAHALHTRGHTRTAQVGGGRGRAEAEASRGGGARGHCGELH